MKSDSLSESRLSEPQAAGGAPAPTSARERSRIETRGRLVRAATELFAEQGLQATTTVQIARRAGVAAGTYYLHFRDKQELFREIVFDALGRVRRRMADAAERAGEGRRVKARARIEELLRFCDENGSLVRILFGRDHEAADLGEQVLDDLVLGTEARLRGRAQACPGSVHPAVMAQALVAAWTRVLGWWVEDPTRAPRDAVIETLLRLDPAITGSKL